MQVQAHISGVPYVNCYEMVSLHKELEHRVGEQCSSIFNKCLFKVYISLPTSTLITSFRLISWVMLLNNTKYCVTCY